MVFTLAKTDWKALYKEYCERLESAPDLSAAAFAREKGLNVNSCRRSFNNIKNKTDRSQSDTEKSDRSPKATTRRKAATDKASKGGGAQTTSSNRAREAKESNVFDHKFKMPPRSNLVDHDHRDDAQGVMHGAYMDLAKIPEDIRNVALQLSDGDAVLNMMQARYLYVHRTHQEMMTAIEKDYEEGNAWKDEFGNPMPKSKALSHVVFGTSKPMTELETGIIKAHQNKQKLDLEQYKTSLQLHDLHPLSKAEQLSLTTELLEQVEQAELSAVSACYLFDKNGIEPPKTLQAEAAKEISLRQPKREEGEEITAEQLDKEMAEYEAKFDEWSGHKFMEERLNFINNAQVDGDNNVEVIE